MNTQLAQSVAVVVFGAGVWILLLGLTNGFMGLVGATAIAFGLIVIIDRLLQDPNAN